MLVVPAGSWQAARCAGAYTLASCTVGPGFEFADFTLLADVPSEVARLRAAGAAIDDLL
jgi:predicted cupin superfamily sugar epimerase